MAAAVDETLAEHADALKVTPGKMVYELQPNIDWDKGKAVLHLLAALGLDSDDVVPLYIGDDSTDEHAFAAIAERGVGILVADPDDREVRGRTTAAQFALRNPGEVQDLLAALVQLDLTGEPELALYDGFDPAEESLRETLTSTGNGYICMRGAAEWEGASDVHYPGTYAHGVYNRETTVMGGRPVLNEDLVNLPNALALNFRHTDEKMRAMDDVEILSYRHEYDVRNAVVVRRLRFRDDKGRETSFTSRRFVSMGRMHEAGLAWDLVAENWSGRLELVSAIDGRVLNRGVPRYRQLEGRHLDPQSPRIFAPDVIALKVRTRQSRIEIAEAVRTRVFQGDRELEVDRATFQTEDYIQQVLSFDVHEREPVRIEKMIALYTSRDRGISEPMHNAGRSVTRYPRFDAALADSARAWEELWDVCDIRVPGDRRVQYLLRLHISHILQVCSRMTAHHDAGVPARGLNGEAYRGHVFWDELYVFPFLNFRLPEITRSLLMYRYRRIGEARTAAAAAGYRGAMYPWQSGSDGQDETPAVHLNPLSGRWDPDLSHNQRHVNAAIFYNIWQYYQATHDVDFLRDYGAEMMLEIARFWSSIAHYNPQRERWEIHGVMGPDEFHEKYPGATEGGLRNNAYTNVMAAWICQTAGEVLELLPATRRQALRRQTGLSDEDIDTWEKMSRRMFVPFHADGIMSQFEGYENLTELDWDHYRARTTTSGGSTGSCAPRARPGRLQDRQAGRRGDAVLPVFGRAAAQHLRAPRLPVRARRAPTDDRVLRPPDLARIDAQPHHPRRRVGDDRPRQLMAALPDRLGERRRRHPGRYDQRGHPHGRHVRNARPRSARLPRHRDPRRRSAIRPSHDGPARRAVAPDAVPSHRPPRGARPRRADHRRAGRGRRGDDQGRLSRRRAPAAPAGRAAFYWSPIDVAMSPLPQALSSMSTGSWWTPPTSGRGARRCAS